VLFSGCMIVDLSSLMSKELTEVRVQEDPHWLVFQKVLLIDISGLISEDIGGGLLSGAPACSPHYLKAVLNKAEQDDAIVAVVLRISSPGGTVSASEQMAREIRLFRERTGLPVIAQINGLGCSGAYYIAAACSRINIQPSAITGSIGVIAILPKYRKLADKVGYEQVVFKSGAMKDIGSAMRDMTEEERTVFQRVIESDYQGFVDWVRENRPAVGDAAAVRALADGRIYSAAQAVENKLADCVCFLDKTLEEAKGAAGVGKAHVVTYSYSDSEDSNIYTPVSASSRLTLADLHVPVLAAPKAGFYYLWEPGE
jgi:protease IV